MGWELFKVTEYGTVGIQQCQILVKSRDFCPSYGGRRRNIAIAFGMEKLDRQTDGQTDRFAISISRVSMLTRDKN